MKTVTVSFALVVVHFFFASVQLPDLVVSLSNPNPKTSKMRQLGIGSGGRVPSKENMPNIRNEEDAEDQTDKRWEPLPPKPSEARLTVVQITDVYTLEHFASIKTMLAETREKLKNYRKEMGAGTTPKSEPKQTLTETDTGVISMLTGDFLAPYLLSSVDRGKGMMRALAETPIDYLTWGNHEADIDHRRVCQHVRNFPGKWINSNMLDHAAMDAQQEYDVVQITSPDGTNTRRIGLCAVLSNDPDLYSHFKAPGAFGGATLTDPWEALTKYKKILEEDENCDVVLPLEHLYAPDDHVTCKNYDFPVVLSGHDHHRVDEVVDGTRLLKPGSDAIYATVLEMSWPDANHENNKPKIKARFVKCDDWDPDPELEEANIRAYDALAPLRNTELARVPPTFEPLSSVGARERVTTMGKFICSLLKSAINTARVQRAHRVDAVLLMGGNIRGGKDYEKGSYFSLEALEAEVKSDETVGVVLMPGWLLAKGVSATHAGDPIPGWIQYDDGVREKYFDDGTPPNVTHVGGLPIDYELTYRVATKISDLTNGQSQPWTDYYLEHPDMLPPKGAYVNIYAELMSFFARNLWRKIWEAITPRVLAEERGKDLEEDYVSPLDVLCDDGSSENDQVEDEEEDDCKPVEILENLGCDPRVDCLPERRLKVLDQSETGSVTVEDIHMALTEILQLNVDETGTEKTLAEFVHNFADADSDGVVTLHDLETFCDELPDFVENQKWRLAFPRPEKLLA